MLVGVRVLKVSLAFCQVYFFYIFILGTDSCLHSTLIGGGILVKLHGNELKFLRTMQTKKYDDVKKKYKQTNPMRLLFWKESRFSTSLSRNKIFCILKFISSSYTFWISKRRVPRKRVSFLWDLNFRWDLGIHLDYSVSYGEKRHRLNLSVSVRWNTISSVYVFLSSLTPMLVDESDWVHDFM